MSNQKVRDIIFPIVKASRDTKGFRFEKFLGTGFLTVGNKGLTSLEVVNNTNLQDTYCVFVVNDQWEVRSIANLRSDKSLNICSFSVKDCPYEGWINISPNEEICKL